MDIRGNQNRRRAKASTLVVLDVLLLLLILAAAVHTTFFRSIRQLGKDLQQQRAFWQQRANGLCGESVPQAPELPADSDPVQQLAFQKKLTEFGDLVLKQYDECQEPVTKPIPEELLHFRTDKYDEYEPKPDKEEAFRIIRRYVDENIKLRNQIYIVGHTDTRGTPQHNYELSYLRALEIATKIHDHLEASGLRQGKDYDLYPVGMGFMQHDEKRSVEDAESWHTRNRRIDLLFRSKPLTRAARAQQQ